MPSDAVHALRQRVREVAAEKPYYRLVLLVGSFKSGKTTALRAAGAKEGWASLGLNAALAERLLHVPTRQRPAVVQELAEDVVREVTGEVLAIDNIEMLFQPDLEVSPLRLLLALSKNRVIVAAWPGAFDGTNLTYAEPGHPEYRREQRPDGVIVTIPLAATTSSSPQTKGEQ